LTKGFHYARTIAFLIAGARLTYYLLSRSGSLGSTVSVIFSSLGKADTFWLLVSLTLFTITELIRAWRWQLLSWSHRISADKAIPLTAVHIGLGHLLPVRLSDVALVGLFKKYASVPLGSGSATVLLAKIMDVIAMGFVVACSFAFYLAGKVMYVASGVCVLALVCLFFLPVILAFFTKPLTALLGNGRITATWKEMAEASVIRPERRAAISKAMVASLAGWAVKLFMFYSLLRAVGVSGIPMWQVFTAAAIMDLTMALPVHGLLSLGTVEAGWVGGFALTGISGNLPGGLSVVEAGFSVHLLWLFMAVLLMLAGIASLLIQKRRRSI
jgi:uncharacterized protein (TIRG00374 family)